MEETWKDIPNYEGLYQVSNFGNVKSLERVIYRSNGRPYTVKEIILKGIIDSTEYLTVWLCKDGEPKIFKVHQLVAMAFLGHTPCGHKIVIDHIDNNRTNNMLDNLQLTTPRHNVSKDIKVGTSKYIGVSWDKANRKWVSIIMINGKNNFLGRFNTEIDAHNAYQKRLKDINDSN